MINNVVLVGRLTKDIELKKTSSNLSTCAFNLAVDRGFKNKEGNTETDFIQCVAWRQSAEYLNQYAFKGAIVSVEGSIQTRNYDGQHGKVYVTEVVANKVSLYSQKSKSNTEQLAKEFASDNNINYTQDDIQSYSNIKEDDLPFY